VPLPTKSDIASLMHIKCRLKLHQLVLDNQEGATVQQSSKVNLRLYFSEITAINHNYCLGLITSLASLYCSTVPSNQ
jgi:hypothetical protein